jgi:alkyldihydroxyacetonephosphate synthase
VLRVYDAFEAGSRYDTGDMSVLLVRELGDPAVTAAVIGVVDDECSEAEHLDDGLVAAWWGHRNDVSALESLTNNGFGVDTMEVTVPWGSVASAYDAVCAAIGAVEGTRLVSAHQSHAYSDGACLYFTFVTRPEDPADRERWYIEAWDAGTRTALEHGASLSHHHGVGLNRSRFMGEALGTAHGALQSIKAALDPNGILNPGKLGFLDPYGDAIWP